MSAREFCVDDFECRFPVEHRPPENGWVHQKPHGRQMRFHRYAPPFRFDLIQPVSGLAMSDVPLVERCEEHVVVQSESHQSSKASARSSESTTGIPDRFAYSMSKGAVLTMTLSVATDYLDDQIRCNCVAPARVHTPFVDHYLKQHYPGREQEMYEALSKTQPIGRMGRPEEIAALVLYLASDASRFVTGSNFPIDGGFVTLHP